MRLLSLFVAFLLSFPSWALAQTGSGGEMPAQMVDVPLHQMMDLNYKTKQEIYALRSGFVTQHPNFLPNPYTPSEDVFGQIQDGKPWWGILGLSYYGPGQQSITGPSEESRFIANPLLLVGLDVTHAYILHTGTPTPIYPQPQSLQWENYLRQGQVVYNLTPFLDEQKRLQDPDPNKLVLAAYNARDLGWNYLYIAPELSTNLTASHQLSQIKQYIHTGSSCGYPGGCNNMSPNQPELEIEVNQLPARAYIKLWKTAPADTTAPADMIFVIDMI